MALSDEDKSIDQAADKLKILIADDDAPTRMLLRAAISQWGYEIVEAKNGEEAWQILQQNNAPRLLILDWLMPKLDGISLCNRIRSELINHHYIILLTQVTGATNIVKGLESGADEFLSKPFNMVELRSRVSVGAKILNFQNKLSGENKKLQENIIQVESLATMVLNILQEISDAIKTNDLSSVTKNGAAYLQRLEELHHNLEHIINDIKKSDLSSSKRS